MQSWLCHKAMHKHFRESNASISALAIVLKERRNSQERQLEIFSNPFQNFHCPSHIPVPIKTQVLKFLIEAELLYFFKNL